jgi:DNA helicase-2/ATP-dependent DNA helicase PcrA
MATGSDDQIEEERRLFYVALTRARDFLEVCFPLRYYKRPRGVSDRHSYAQLTRFLPQTILDRFEQVSLQPEPADSQPSPPRLVTADIRQRIASMWT